MNKPTKTQLLQQITAIPTMERGKLSSYRFKDRSGDSGPYYKLQQWKDGKNQTRYIPTEDLPAVKAALAGYSRYQHLTEQYADQVIAETHQNLADSKKNKSSLRSSWPKKRKSSNSSPSSKPAIRTVPPSRN